MFQLLNTLLIGITSGAIYALMALSIVLVWRSTRVINFAQAGQALTSTFIGFQTLKYVDSFWVALAVAMIAGAAISALIEITLMRVLLKHSSSGAIAGVAPIIATLGLLEVIQATITLIWGGADSLITPPLSNTGFTIGTNTLVFSPMKLAIIAIVGILLVLLSLIVQKTSIGLSLRAAAFSPELARLAGVRVDAGFTQGDVIGGNFDSLLAKLIVTGSTREEAIERSKRALAEFKVEGLATALPFHRAILEDENYTKNFKVYTSYIENEFVNEIPQYEASSPVVQSHAAPEHVITEVNGHRFEVLIHAPEPVHKRHRARKGASGGATGDGLLAPMQGTVVKIAVEEGQKVVKGDLILVLEAMKMEQPVEAHKDGVISGINAEVGQTVSNGHVLLNIDDAE